MSSYGAAVTIPHFPEECQLTGENNWRPFKAQVKAHINVRMLTGYLDRTIPMPTSNTATISIYPSATAPSSITPSIDEWYQRDRMAASIITLNIKDPVGLGVEEDKPAAHIWAALVTKFERHDEQLIFMADEELRHQKYDPKVNTMEEHEMRMKNLAKKLRDLGGTLMDHQFRLIVISSMPSIWKQYTLNVPGHSSDDAFVYLRQLYVSERREVEAEKRDRSHIRAMIAEAMAQANVVAANPKKDRPKCTNPNCPPRNRLGHPIEKCWAPGGGDEGGGARRRAERAAKSSFEPVANSAQASESTSVLELFELCTSAPSDPTATTPDAHAYRNRTSAADGYGAKEEVGKGSETYIHMKTPTCFAAKDNRPLLYGPPRPPFVRTFLDSAASDHFWVRRGDFVVYEDVYNRNGNSAIAGKSGEFRIHGKGVVEFDTVVDGTTKCVRLSGVLHTPSFHHNLISLRTLDARGMVGEWGKGCLTVRTADGRVIMRGEGRGTMYEVQVDIPMTATIQPRGTPLFVQPTANSSRSRNKPADIHTWHRRLGHVSIPRILQMEHLQLVDGLQITSKRVEGKCEPCLYGKAIRKPFDEKLNHETEVLERVHLDLFGPTRTQSRGGVSYMFLASDGRSSVKAPNFLSNKRKETSLAAIHEFRVMAEKQTGKLVKCFRVDGGGEFDNDWMRQYCKDEGIKFEMVPPHSSSANGVAERAIRTVMEGVRIFLEDSGFPPSMWAEAALTFCYVSAFVPSARFPDEVPIEKYTGRRHDVAHLRLFGCRAWATLHRTRTDGKLARQAIEGRLVGYIGRRGYKLWIPEWREIHESHDVEFEEGDPRRTTPAVPDVVDGDVFGLDELEVEEEAMPLRDERARSDVNDTSQRQTLNDVRHSTPPTARDLAPIAPESTPPPVEPTPALPINNPAPDPAPPRRSSRIRTPSTRQLDSDASAVREREAATRGLAWTNNRPIDEAGEDTLADNALALIVQSPWAFASESSEAWVPASYKQAMRRPDLWVPPMKVEYETLMEKGCWDLVDLPPGANLTGGRWVYAIKWAKDGTVAKRKARYVAQGFTQVHGVDYDKTYGAVARMESVRIVLAIIAVLGLSIFQVDFKAAFLNSPITHDVYVKQPEGFVRPGTEDKVCKLNVSIYGTKQGSHDWQDTLSTGYEEDGYTTSRADPCVRYRRRGDEYTITSTYGDDVEGGSSTEEGKKSAIADLGKRWESSEVNSGILLGMAIAQDPSNRAVTISQKAYFLRMLEHFNLSTVIPRCTPLNPKVPLVESPNPLPDDERIFMSGKPYCEVVGSVLWGQSCMRPDIAFATNALARFQLNPGRLHWEAIEWLAGYLLWTIDYCITYRAPSYGDTRRGCGLKPFGYSDSDYGGCLDTRRSTSGYVFMMGGAPVCWSSKRQDAVSLSTVEAEYIALSQACQQACWLVSFLSEVDLAQEGPLEILGDNFGSVSLTEEGRRHSLTKHIDLRWHYVREKVNDKTVVVTRIRSGQNAADVLTKALTGPVHREMINLLGLDRTE